MSPCLDFAWLGAFVKVHRSTREWQRKPAKGIQRHRRHLDPQKSEKIGEEKVNIKGTY